MTQFLTETIGIILYPHKLFAQMETARSYRKSDVYLLAFLSFTLVLGVWAYSVMAGGLRESIAAQSLVILFFVSTAIIIAAFLGRLWAKYVAWVIRRFTADNVDVFAVYQVFVLSLVPVFFRGLFLLLTFSSNLFGLILPFSSVFYYLELIFNWVPLWVILLQWAGLIKSVGVSWDKAILIVLAPLLIPIAIVVVIPLLVFLLSESTSF